MDIMGAAAAGGGSGIYCGASGNGWQYETAAGFADPTSDGSLGIVPAIDANFGTTSAAAVTWVITQTAGPARAPTVTARGSLITDGYDFNILPGAQGDYSGCEFQLDANISGADACNTLVFYCDVAWAYSTQDYVAVDPTSVGSLVFLPGASDADLTAVDPTVNSSGNAGNITWTVTQIEGPARTIAVNPTTGDLVDGYTIVFDAVTYGGFAMTSFKIQGDIGGTPVRSPVIVHCIPFLASGSWDTSTAGLLIPTTGVTNDFGTLTTTAFAWTIIPNGSGETISTPVFVSGNISDGFTYSKSGPNPVDIVGVYALVVGRPPYYGLTPTLSV